MIRVEERRESLQLNMAPMIDMIFLLIIFFLTATTFSEKEREQDVLLPSNRNPGSLSRSVDNNVIVNVLKDGSLIVFGEELQADELRSMIQSRRKRATVPLKVQVRADRRTVYENVARALEAIELAGVQRPYVVARSVDLEE